MTKAQTAFAIFSKGEILTANQLAYRLGWTRLAASKTILKLQEQGRLQRHGETWPPVYEAKADAPAFPEPEKRPNPTTVSRALANRPALQSIWGAANA